MASSPSREFLRSPFENVLHILPQGHDKALKQAFYNTAAILFALFACGAALAVYYILEPFLRPLLWAVLCGTFLFPFKYALTGAARSWLRSLQASGTPLVVGTLLIPAHIVDSASEQLGSLWWDNIRLVVAGCTAIPLLYLLVYLYPVHAIYEAAVSAFLFMYEAIGYFSAVWVWSIVVSYVLLLVVFWKPERTMIFKILSLPVWIAATCHIASVIGPLRVPLFILVIALLITGLVAELSQMRTKYKSNLLSNATDDSQQCEDSQAMSQQSSSNQTTSQQSDTSQPSTQQSTTSQITLSSSQATSQQSSTSSSSSSGTSEAVSDVTGKVLFSPQDSLSKAAVEEKKSETPLHTPATTSKSSSVKSSLSSGCASVVPPSSLFAPRGRVRKERGKGLMKRHEEKKSERSLSDYCFIALLWSLVVVHLWIYNFVILLLPLLLLFFGIKRLGEYLGVFKWIKTTVKSHVDQLQDKLDTDPRVNIKLPSPARRLGTWILQGDSKIISTLDGAMDKIASVFIIVLLIVGVALVTIFTAMEIHRESMHLVSLSSDILNKTSHPELTQWLPDQDVVQETVDSMVSNAYVYGREWISNKLNGMLNGDDASKMQVEKQVLKLWDKMYMTWFTKNKTGEVLERDKAFNRQLSFDLTDLSSASEVMNKMRQLDLDLVGFARENVEVFLSLMKSVWAVLVSNVAMTVKVIMSMLSVIFGGGTAIFNVFLSAIVFLTTLFYLLASSGNQYKPVELFVSLSPAQRGNDISFGKAFEDAIGSVFLASLKMAAFYGMYTWLTHTIFAIQIIFIPSALAAIFAAVPFLGTYIAALPAVIELWLVHGEKFHALLLFTVHYLPTLFVDTAIYSEIKGSLSIISDSSTYMISGHPYLTGLAIAGGIFWLGLQGAIIGPILLCCLIVAVNMYQTFLRTEPTAEESDADKKRMGTADDKRVKFNLAKSALASRSLSDIS